MKALKANEVQGGNMSVTTFIKGRQGGEPVSVFGLAMNDATRANADDPLAIIARKDSGIKAGDLKTLKGKKVGVWFEQTPDEYLKIALSKAGLISWEFIALDAPLPLEFLFDPLVDVAPPFDRTSGA